VERIILVGIAGALGALSRYGLQVAIHIALGRPTVLSTMLVNVSGSFLLGLFIALTDSRQLFPMFWRPIVAAGFFGAYTTFSTLMLESIDRWESGDLLTVGANLAGSIVLGLIAAYAGLSVGRVL
jgi:CrcB protein